MLTREMKDSGVEWIGETPKEWEVGKLKFSLERRKELISKFENQDILSLTMKGVIKRNLDNPTGKMPSTFDGYQLIQKNSLIACLFDIDVTPRCIGISNYSGLTSPAYTQFLIKKGFDIKFIFYYLLFLDNDKVLVPITKSLRNTIKSEDFLNLPVSYPRYEIQKKVSEILEDKIKKIDIIISDTQQSIIELKKYKQSLITETVTKGLDKNADIVSVCSDYTCVKPNNWLSAKLKNLCSMKSGNSISSEKILSSGKYEVYGANGNRGMYDDFNISGEILLVGRQGALSGNVHYVNDSIWATEHALITINKNTILIKYLYYLIKSMNLNQYAHNAAQPGISASFILNRVCFIPYEKKEQQQIVDFLDEKTSKIDSLIKDKEQIIKEYEDYKKSLIYEYVTGKKQV